MVPSNKQLQYDYYGLYNVHHSATREYMCTPVFVYLGECPDRIYKLYHSSIMYVKTVYCGTIRTLRETSENKLLTKLSNMKRFNNYQLSPLLSHLLSPLFTQEVQQLPVISPSIPFIISLVYLRYLAHMNNLY